MLTLIRLHTNYLLTFKTRVIVVVFSGVVAVVLLYLTRFYESRVDHILYKDYYVFDYFMEGFNFLKMSLLVLLVYLSIQITIFSPYDVALIQRISPSKLFVSKTVVLSLVIGVIAAIWGLVFLVFGYGIHQEVDALITLDLMKKIILMIVFYAVFLMVIGMVFNHIFALLLVIIGVLMTEVFVDFNVALNAIPWTGYLFNVLFVNIHVLDGSTVRFIPADRVVLYLIIVYGVVGVCVSHLTKPND